MPRSADTIIFTETALKGVFLIEPGKHFDYRGYFARTYCEQEFASHGLKTHWVQCSISFNRTKGTLRGMHFQSAPFQETKLIRCGNGAIHDVVIDLRPESGTYKQHLAFELSSENGKMLYIPENFAHGFQTLMDSTEVVYQMSQFYAPEHSQGVRWDDPAFGIKWPSDHRIIIDRDRSYSDFVG